MSSPPKKDDKKDKKNEEEEMSEEDLILKENIDLMVERVKDVEEGIQIAALESLRAEIHTSTASLSGIPKAIKFLRPHYQSLKDTWEEWSSELKSKKLLADVLSVLAMSIAPEGSNESLKYRLAGSFGDLDYWGHEYVRNLSAEIISEFTRRVDNSEPVDELLAYVDLIVPFNMKHNAEPEACDLLLEVEKISEITKYTDERNCERICLYLTNIANYSPEPDDTKILEVVYVIYKQFKKFTDALVLSLKLDNPDKVREIFELCDDPIMRKQICFILGRQQSYCLNLEDEPELAEIVGNTTLEKHYKQLAKDLDVLEPKEPKDIYKNHLLNLRGNENNDIPLDRLSSSFVNAFVNAGFCTSGLFTSTEDNSVQKDSDQQWVQQNRESNKTSVVASIGLIHLWDEGGVSVLEKYLHDDNVHLRSGGILGVGVLSSGVCSEHELALSLLSEYLGSENPAEVRLNTVLALGIAYAGSAKEQLLDLLGPIYEEECDINLISITSYALGLIFVGSSNGDIAAKITEVLLSRTPEELSNTISRYLCLGLALLYLGKQGEAEVTMETLKVIEGPISKYALFTLQTCAYAGTGSVDQIQELLQACTDHIEENNSFQAVSVLGIALVAMGEEIGSEMSIRTFNHLLQYGESVIKRSVPLAFGLLSVSNPRVTLVDTLSKLSHDADLEVAKGAIFSLGLIGAGTNNSRIAHLLRQLSQYYSRDSEVLFIIRLAQGLLHLGKGLMTLGPYHCHNNLMSKVAIAGILGVLHACLDFPGIVNSKHNLLYSIVSAMRPRMLMTFDENLNPLEVSVRVGQAVDTVGQAGKPKTITGFQTHTTPVLISFGERAELTTDDYIPCSSFLENCVILKPNPEKQ